MEPVKILEHVKQAKARLTSMYVDRKVISGLVAAYAKQIQLLEDACWQVIEGRQLNTAVNAQLDTIGKLVGELRNGRTDTVYREFIRLRILINRSTGKLVDLLHIAKVAAMGAPWKYWESYPAGFVLLFSGTAAGFAAVASAMRQAKPQGVGPTLMYTSTPFADLFRPKDDVSGLGGRGPSHTDGLPGYKVAHIE